MASDNGSDGGLSGTIPPDRANITEVARGVRSQCMLGSVYCPNVCYVIEGGKMRLMTFVEIPDAGSDRRLLFVVRGMHPVRRMTEYRDEIYRELRAAGVDV